MWHKDASLQITLCEFGFDGVELCWMDLGIWIWGSSFCRHNFLWILQTQIFHEFRGSNIFKSQIYKSTFFRHNSSSYKNRPASMTNKYDPDTLIDASLLKDVKQKAQQVSIPIIFYSYYIFQNSLLNNDHPETLAVGTQTSQQAVQIKLRSKFNELWHKFCTCDFHHNPKVSLREFPGRI
jgi:hypothetical protein